MSNPDSEGKVTCPPGSGGETADPQAGTLEQTDNRVVGLGHLQGGTIADLQQEELILQGGVVLFPQGVVPGHPGHQPGGEELTCQT